MFVSKILSTILTLCVGVLAHGSLAYAKESGNYPDKAVKILLGYNPGAATDIVAREVAQKLSEIWDVPVLVENRSGANTIIASNAVAKAKPDGYTLLLSNSSNATNPFVYEHLPYDAEKDFTNIALLAIADNLITTSPSTGIKTVKDLITFAKKNPGEYTYGSVGVGSAQHLLMELFSKSAGIELTHIPYKGAGAAMVDVVGERISGLIGTIASQNTLVGENKLQPLFITSGKRSSVLPEVETLAESGFPDIVSGYWLGLSGPAGIPEEIVQKINADVNNVLKTSDLEDRFSKLALEPMGGSIEEMDEYFTGELAFWKKAAEAANIERLRVN